MPAIEVDGLRAFVREEGQGDPVLLVHGWGFSHRIWLPTIEALRGRCRVIAVDLPGCGDSGKPEAPYSVPWFARWLARAMDALGLESATLVGHSMGGTIALTLALDEPERVGRLVLVNALVQGPTAFGFRTKLLTRPLVRRVAYGMSKFQVFRRWLARDFTYEAPLSEELIAEMGLGTFASLIRPIISLRETDLAGRLKELRAPTLVITTDRDRVLLPAQFEIQRSIPGAEIILLSDAGHCPQQECPEEFHKVLGAFLTGSPGRPASLPLPARRTN